MADFLDHALSAEASNLFILVGLFLVAVGVLGKIAAWIEPGQWGRVASVVAGVILILSGLYLHSRENGNSEITEDTDSAQTPQTSTEPEAPAPSSSIAEETEPARPDPDESDAVQFRVVGLALDPPVGRSGPCPLTVPLSATISAVGPGGEVSYAFALSSGPPQDIQTVRFDSPSTQNLRGDITFDQAYDGTVALRVYQPDEEDSEPRPLRVECRDERDLVVAPTSNLVARLELEPMRGTYLGERFATVLEPTRRALDEILGSAELEWNDIETIDLAVDLDSIDLEPSPGRGPFDSLRAALAVELSSPLSDARLDRALTAFAEAAGLSRDRRSLAGRDLVIVGPSDPGGGPWLSVYASLARSGETAFLASGVSTLGSILEREDSGAYVTFPPFHDATETGALRAAMLAPDILNALAEEEEEFAELLVLDTARLSARLGTSIDGTIVGSARNESSAGDLSRFLNRLLQEQILPDLPIASDAIRVRQEGSTVQVTVHLTESDLRSLELIP